KEGFQVLRDPSSFAIGIVLPLILILLFGYGVSLDVMHVPVAIVVEAPSPDTAEVAAGFSLSPYFDASRVNSAARAEELMLRRKVDGMVVLRQDLARNLRLGAAPVQVIVHGTDANRGRIMQVYALGALGQLDARRAGEGRSVAAGPAQVE